MGVTWAVYLDVLLCTESFGISRLVLGHTPGPALLPAIVQIESCVHTDEGCAAAIMCTLTRCLKHVDLQPLLSCCGCQLRGGTETASEPNSHYAPILYFKSFWYRWSIIHH